MFRLLYGVKRCLSGIFHTRQRLFHVESLLGLDLNLLPVVQNIDWEQYVVVTGFPCRLGFSMDCNGFIGGFSEFSRC